MGLRNGLLGRSFRDALGVTRLSQCARYDTIYFQLMLWDVRSIQILNAHFKVYLSSIEYVRYYNHMISPYALLNWMLVVLLAQAQRGITFNIPPIQSP